MSQLSNRLGVRAALLSATCLTASPAAAQDASVDERLDRLEVLIEELIEQLDAQQGPMKQGGSFIGSQPQPAE